MRARPFLQDQDRDRPEELSRSRPGPEDDNTGFSLLRSVFSFRRKQLGDSSILLTEVGSPFLMTGSFGFAGCDGFTGFSLASKVDVRAFLKSKTVTTRLILNSVEVKCLQFSTEAVQRQFSVANRGWKPVPEDWSFRV